MQFHEKFRGMRLVVWAIGLSAVSGAYCVGRLSAADAPAPRLFEMRTYVAHPGKLSDLHKRFRDHTTKLFEKHGMTNIGYWTPADGPEAETTLIYILAYPSKEAREKSWKGFMDDPEWKTAYKESHKNGPLVAKVVSKFLNPTDYSAVR